MRTFTYLKEIVYVAYIWIVLTKRKNFQGHNKSCVEKSGNKWKQRSKQPIKSRLEVISPNGISIESAIFPKYTVVSNQQTDEMNRELHLYQQATYQGCSWLQGFQTSGASYP